MSRILRAFARFTLVLPVAVVAFSSPSLGRPAEPALAAESPVDFVVENLDGSQFVYVVFHALDRDGFCQPPAGAVSLHPIIDMPVDFVIEAGDGVIIESSSGATPFGRTADDVPTFSTAVNAASASPIRSFPPLVDGLTDECQAWIKVSQSIPGPLRVLVTVPGDDGASIGFVADLERSQTVDVSLQFRWSLITWQGKDGRAPSEALGNAASQVTAMLGWDPATQNWRAFFPGGSGVPGANDLTALKAGSAYWVAIKGPGPVTWSVAVP